MSVFGSFWPWLSGAEGGAWAQAIGTVVAIYYSGRLARKQYSGSKHLQDVANWKAKRLWLEELIEVGDAADAVAVKRLGAHDGTLEGLRTAIKVTRRDVLPEGQALALVMNTRAKEPGGMSMLASIQFSRMAEAFTAYVARLESATADGAAETMWQAGGIGTVSAQLERHHNRLQTPLNALKQQLTDLVEPKEP